MSAHLHERSGTAHVRRVPGPAELDPVGFNRRRNRIERLLAWGTPAFLFVLWQLAAEVGWIDVRFFPAPTTIFEALWESIEDGTMTEAVWVTTRKLLIGFAAGTVGGWIVGTLLATVRPFRAAFEPILIALYTVPKLAVLPVLLLIFGFGETPQLVLLASSVFFVVTLGVAGAIRAIDIGYLDAARSFGATRRQVLRHVILPGALPGVASSMQVAAGMSVLVVVGLELVVGGDGLGNLIWSSWQVFLPARTYAGVIVASVLGVAFTTAVSAAMRRLSPWAADDRAT